jgi:hypothetical protein
MNTVFLTHASLSVATTLIATLHRHTDTEVAQPRIEHKHASSQVRVGEVVVESTFIYSIASILYMILISLPYGKGAIGAMYANALFYSAAVRVQVALLLPYLTWYL